MTNQIDIKVITIAVLISLSVGIFFLPFVQTALYFTMSIQLSRPLNAYFPCSQLPLALAAVYVGFFCARSPLINGAGAGILYYAARRLYSLLFFHTSYADIHWVSSIYAPLRDGFLCALGSWLTYKLVVLARGRKLHSSNKSPERTG